MAQWSLRMGLTVVVGWSLAATTSARASAAPEPSAPAAQRPKTQRPAASTNKTPTTTPAKPSSSPTATGAKTSTPATKPSKKATPARGKPAPVRTDVRESEVYADRLNGLQSEINALKDRVFRSKARLALLKETVLRGVMAGSRVCSRTAT